MTTDGSVDAGRVRRWLTDLTRPERLADPHMAALLRAHGRTAAGPPLEVGHAAAALLEDAIAALAPTGLPHRVLDTCFVQGIKSRGAAARLGLSERQLSRERSRAIALLAAQLAPRHEGLSCGAPPSLPRPFLARPHLSGALAEAITADRRAGVAGPTGSGKTTLVAAYAAATPVRCFWCRPGPRGTIELPALLFDLGEHLARHDPSLATYVRGALPEVDVTLATRIALAGLGGRERLLVFDGARVIDAAVASFLAEAAARLPLLSVVEIGVPAERARVSVPPFEVAETRALLDLAGAPADQPIAAKVHAWTGGNPRLVAAAAGWLAGDTRRRDPLDDALRQRPGALTVLRAMAGAARRAAPAGVRV